MTRLTPPSKPDARRYGERVLRMNPLFDATRILAARREWLGAQAATAADEWTWTRASVEERANAERNLDRIRGAFWSMPLDSLKAQLEQFDVSRVPELQPAVSRLRMVAACRGEFPRLLAEPKTDKNLFVAFKNAAVASPAEAGLIKERFLRQLNDPDRYPTAIQTARRIRSSHPFLYQLEKDWFETILSWKKPRRKIDVSIAVPEFESSLWFRPAAAGVILLIVKLLAAMMR